MGLYSRYVLPRIIHLTCGTKPACKQREKILPRASGRVLELGFGSGLNLPFYDRNRVEKLFALEPEAGMWKLAEEALASAPFDVERLETGAEAVPLPDASIDTVLVTYSLCTIPDVPAALAQARRVLAPGGELLFCEHGLAPDPGVAKWQQRLDPIWTRFTGGCHINRDLPAAIREAAFEIDGLESMYLPRTWRPAGFNVWGTARVP